MGPAPQSTRPAAAPAAQGPSSFPPLPAPDPRFKIPFGQTLVYRAEWRVFNAGTATLRIDRAGQEARVVGTANATGSVAVLYPVHDVFESFLDPTTFCSHTISKRTQEGTRHVDTNIMFNYQRGKAVLDQKNIKKNETRHEEHDIPACVTDVVSAIYYVGTLPLQTGKTYSFPLNDGGNTVTVDLHVEAREQIKVPAGAYNAVRVHPEASSGVLKEKGKMWLWYSDDTAHIPLQMRARMLWGTVTLTLERIDR